MKRPQRRSSKQRQIALPIARRHRPKSQSSALHPSLVLLSHLLCPLDCLLIFMSCTPDDLTRLFASESRFMMLPSHEPPWLRDQPLKKRTRLCFYLLAPFHCSDGRLCLVATRSAAKS